MADKNIQPQHITNMDEVLLTFDIPVNRTVEKMGTSTVSVRTTGHEKSCSHGVCADDRPREVLLAGQADGQKLPPMVIFKRKTLPKDKFPAGVIIKVNPKGWMDEDMMGAWLREMYTKRRDGFFHTSPAMLISMQAHLTDAVKIQVKRTNTELTIIPGGLTKELQVLDIGVNRSFKAKVRAAWERWMTNGEHMFTKLGRQRRSTYATICEWIADAWANVSVQTVVPAFTKAGVTTGEPSNDSDIDLTSDEPGASEPSALGSVLGQFFMSDTKDEDFEGFMNEE